MLKYRYIRNKCMVRNFSKDKNKLRRQGLTSTQIKSQNRGKKSLSKRIIAERVGGITSQNIEAEFDRLAEAVLIDETTATIIYHLKFARDARPATFNDDVIEAVFDRIKDLQVKFLSGIITAKEQLEILKDIDAEIMSRIDNWDKTK